MCAILYVRRGGRYHRHVGMWSLVTSKQCKGLIHHFYFLVFVGGSTFRAGFLIARSRLVLSSSRYSMWASNTRRFWILPPACDGMQWRSEAARWRRKKATKRFVRPLHLVRPFSSQPAGYQTTPDNTRQTDRISISRRTLANRVATPPPPRGAKCLTQPLGSLVARHSARHTQYSTIGKKKKSTIRFALFRNTTEYIKQYRRRVV